MADGLDARPFEAKVKPASQVPVKRLKCFTGILLSG